MNDNGKLMVVGGDGRSMGAPVPEWTPDQVELIQRTVANGTTNDEFKLFLYTAKRTGLDPLVRQIHAVKRAGKMAIQTAIDGYRLIADRTGKYAGNDDPVFDDEKTPRKASVTVYKIVDGQRCPFTATARWEQYFPGETQGFMWKKMPHLMLGKCAEALALRKAFPAEMGGVYVQEEMEQASVEEAPTAPATLQVAPATPKVAQAVTPQVVSDPAGQIMVDTITDVRQTSGESTKGQWKRFQITTAGGAKLVTFDRKCGDVAISAMNFGKAASMQFKKPDNPKFALELVSIDFRGDAPAQDTDALEEPPNDL
jgi:phage recombination protein Bet